MWSTVASAGFRRAAAASLVAFAGAALLLLGPAGVVLGWYAYQEVQQEGGERLGVEVRDGPISFVVHEVRCGAAENGESTHGKLCQVTLEARNRGTEEVTVPGRAQMLHGSEGARHVPTGDPEPFGTLATSEAATAVIAFDLPPDSAVTHVEVHGDIYSRGEVVALGGQPLPLLPGQAMAWPLSAGAELGPASATRG